MKPSKNFHASELIRSQYATRHGIDNTPPPAHLVKLKYLTVNILQPVRNEFGPVVISSGYRSKELNKAVGGSLTSQLSLGEAADFEVPGIDNKKVANWIKNNLKFDQLILEFYKDGDPNSGWIHCSFAEGDNRNECLRAVKVDGKTQYQKGW